MKQTSDLTAPVAAAHYNHCPLYPGNIIIHTWYKKFCDSAGNSDLVAITILSDILAWRRNGTSDYFGEQTPKLEGNTLVLSYNYFEEKFSLSKDRVRRALVRLEGYNVLQRTIKNIELSTGARINKVLITLNQKFYESCFRDPELDIRADNNKQPWLNLYNQVLTSTKNSPISIQVKPSHDQHNDHISNNIFYKKNRSMKSDSSKSESNILKFHFKERKLLDFYPLSPADASELQSSCRRQFSQNAMNEILYDMAKRLGNRTFNSKKAFMSYMSKVFVYEMRDAVKVSNVNFKIKSNQNIETINLQAQERYLADVENSLEVSSEWHLKKKLACVFETTKSYNLLKAYSSVSREGGSFKLYLDKQIELTKSDKEIILKQVKATHERLDTNDKQLGYIDELEIIMPQATLLKEFSKGTQQRIQPVAQELPVGIWRKIRESLKSIYGEATDKNWFSKLEATIHEETKEIKLTAPTSFVTDWIKANYLDPIEKITSQINYKVFLS